MMQVRSEREFDQKMLGYVWALKMGEGTASQGMQTASSSWKGQGMDSFLGPPEKITSIPTPCLQLTGAQSKAVRE